MTLVQLCATVAVATVTLLGAWCWSRERKRKQLGLKGLFYFTAYDTVKAMDYFTKWHQAYGQTFYVSALGVTVTCDYDLIKVLFESRDHFPTSLNFREALSLSFGPSMFTSEGHTWKTKHNTLMPLFHNRMLKLHTEVTCKKVHQLMQLVESELAGKPPGSSSFNLLVPTRTLLLDMIGFVAFGHDFQGLTHPNAPLTDSTGTIKMTASECTQAIIFAMNSRLMLPIRLIWSLPLPIFQKEKKAIAVLKHLFGSLISEYRSTHQAAGDDHGPTNLLSLILSSRNTEDASKHSYTDEEAIAESFSIFGAGHDTTISTLGFIYNELAKQKQVQERVRAEVLELLKNHQEGLPFPTFEEVNSMSYLDNVIKETTRLFPVATFLVRQAADGFKFGNTYFPEGSEFYLNIYEHNRDPKVYENPLQFDPDRWTKKETPPLMSFGFGVRQCFGRRYAMLEMKIILALLLIHYELDVDPERPFVAESKFGYRPKDDIVSLRMRRLPAVAVPKPQ